ncbi:copper transport protein [Catenuloplanes nepalensis]|uniref:Copper transport protein n=2 Tax=Catenuloplanes nepalensis TaxID=587533 RepID=A0ABT9N7N5_9ACTN|nr:copper transport protein [Catenuloplanes nepalensis]
MTAERRRRWAVLAALVLGALAVFVGPASPASAHAVLQRTTPAAQSVVQTPPGDVKLTFTEGVSPVNGKIQVIAPNGDRVGGDPRAEGSTLIIPVTADQRGTYLVSYRVISADSHPVSGAFTFSVGATSAVPVLAEDGDDTDPVVKNTIPVAKFIGYAGLVLVVGPVLVLLFLWPARLSRRTPARLVRTGLGLIAFSTLAALYLQAPYTGGGNLLDAGGLGDVVASSFGTALLVRLGLLAAIAIMLRPILAERGDGGRGDGGRSGENMVDLIVLAALGTAAVFTWPLTGHPSASPVAAVSVVVDAIHLVSMAVWLGGLVMLVGFLLRQAGERELSAILPIWSRWAALAVSALLLAGVVNALIEIGTLDALTGTTYGRFIIAKTALFAAVVGVAAYSRSLVRKRVTAENPGRIRTAVWAELAITVVVLGVTSVLVQQTPARTESENAVLAGEGYFSVLVDSPLYTLQVELDPAKVGSNSMHLYSYEPGTTNLLKAEEWTTTAALPAAGIEPIDVPMLRVADNHAISEFQLPAAGTWEFTFTLRTTEIDQATVTVTVDVAS